MRLWRAVLGVCITLVIVAAAAAEPAPAGQPERVWRVGVFEAPP